MFDIPIHLLGYQSIFLPFLNLLCQMLLQLFEFVTKHLPTPPALEIFLQTVILICHLLPWIVVRKREVGQRNEELSVETVVVFPIPHGLSRHVWRDDMDVEVVHTGMRVDADFELRGEVSTWWQFVWWIC